MPYMWHPQRKHTNEHIYKTETDSHTYRMNLWLPWGLGGGRIRRELASTVHMALFKTDDQRSHTVEHTEFCLTSCGSTGGGPLWGEGIHIYERLRTSRATWKEHHDVNWLFSKTK